MKFQAHKRKGKPIVTGILALLALAMVAFFVLSNPVDTTLLTATAIISSSGSNACTPGSFADLSQVVISKSAIASTETSRLNFLKRFTTTSYKRCMMMMAGEEHYALLHYLVKNYGDCHHITDIGTRVAASSLVLGSHGTPVYTFDIPKSRERVAAFRGRSEGQWQKELHAAQVDITFYNLDLLQVSDEDFRRYMSTWLILLDTFHWPDTQPFEREYFDRLVKMGFKGILLLDDIHLNPEMEKWWKELQDSAGRLGYIAYDVTNVGHFSGTGLLDFSGKVRIAD